MRRRFDAAGEGKKQAEAKQPGREVKDVTDFRRMLEDPTVKLSLALSIPELPAVGARRPVSMATHPIEPSHITEHETAAHD